MKEEVRLMSKARIMVVEDEGVVALQIRESLENLGYAVPLSRPSGEEAVEKVLETEPDLVLMDIKLTGRMSGIDAARKIQSRLDVPVVYLTAFSDAETLELAQATDPYGYVLKPFDEKSLNAVIQMSLAKHRHTREARENAWWMTAVAESMMEAVLICDAKGYVKFINPSAEALIGRAEPEVREKRMRDVVELVDAQKHTLAAVPRHRAPPGGQEHPARQLRPGGRGGQGDPRGVQRLSPAQPGGNAVRHPLRAAPDRDLKEHVQGRVLKEMEELARLQRRSLPSGDTVDSRLSLRVALHPGGLRGRGRGGVHASR